VTNRPDGAVEAVFEGDDASVDRMVEFTRAGPGHATIDDLEVHEEDPEGLSGFEVR
jgi:acylphosphatase